LFEYLLPILISYIAPPKKRKREVLLVKLKYHKIHIQVGLLQRSPEDSLKKENNLKLLILQKKENSGTEMF
jgi:hypothetical protein